MRFHLVSLEKWPESQVEDVLIQRHSRNGIDGPLPAQAAKKIAESGGRGLCVLEDEDGHRTAWKLHATVLHYAYPVFLPGEVANG